MTSNYDDASGIGWIAPGQGGRIAGNYLTIITNGEEFDLSLG